MGRSKRTKRKVTKQRPRKDNSKRESYDDIKKENQLFENYYKAQKVISDEEWPEFMKSMQSGLNSTFRITGTRDHAKELMKYLKKYYLEPLADVKLEDGEGMECFGKPLTWYPDELAWQINLTRRIIRRSEVVSSFHKFLVNESEMGNLSRQEAVSMIPPLLIDVKPHHKILDLCAAPGSKTAQLIEMLHEKQTDKIPEGFVIANDIDPKRCYMLVHQSRRIHSPCCLVTNHDAAAFPDINIKQEDSESTVPLLFDRILCDVPCSGDGTMRKNPQIWKKWNPEIGVNLHKTQLRILVRAVEMLAIGGKVIYSTCSLNPVENEAVVSQLLLRAKGSVVLVDVSDKLPLLKRSHGLTTWQLQSKDGRHLPTFAKCTDQERTHGFVTSMWPPTSDEAESCNLSQCLRLYPHQQDTGGFFIAVLEKKSELPWKAGYRPGTRLLPWELTKREKMDIKLGKVKSESQTKVQEEEKSEERASGGNEASSAVPGTGSNNQSSSDAPPNKKRRIDKQLKENPFIFVENTDVHWTAIRNFYEIAKEFPQNNLLVRSDGGRKRVIYFVSTGVSVVLKNIEQDKFRVVNAGLRMFTRCENSDQPWSFRINGESLDTVLPFLSKKRVITVPQDDLIKILVDVSPKVSQMTTETKSALGNIGPGCIIFLYDPKDRDDNDTIQVPIGVCGWRSKTVILRSLISKGDRLHYLRIAGFAPDSTEIQGSVDQSSSNGQETTNESNVEERKGLGCNNEPDGSVIVANLGNLPVPAPPPGITDVGFI